MADIDTDTAGEATAIPSPHAFAAPRRGRRRRWQSVLVIVCVTVALLLGVTVVVLSRWSVNDYALTPGDAAPVAPDIQVPAALDHPLHGKILLTDVYVTQVSNALSYLRFRYFTSDAQVLPSAEVLGPATTANEFSDQGYLEMYQAQSYATAAALTALGYDASSQNAGALIYGIVPHSAAARVLKVSQVITAVNGKKVTTACSLGTALQGLLPGTTATLSVEQSSISQSGAFVPGPLATRKITLGTPPKGLNEAGCGEPKTAPTAFLGIEPETQVNWRFPINVEVRTANIGGPSAGLAMTLGIIDKLSGGHLTGNRVVAATGTIDPQGNVGDVGGVPQKTVAVEQAGATVFFVPPQEYKAALSKDTPQLHVYAVSTLDQALGILKRLGGTVPPSHVPLQAAP